jgi:type VI secretion system protein ImpC
MTTSPLQANHIIAHRLNWQSHLPALTDLEAMDLDAALAQLQSTDCAAVQGSSNLCHLIDELLLRIDARLSAQMNAILHHPDFQSLESSWRGLACLLDKLDGSSDVELKVLDIDSQTLLEDFRCAADFDQSLLFRHVYEEEYGSFGGNPFTVLVLDQAVGSSHDDLFLLEQITRVGAAAHAPVIASPAPGFFGLDNMPALSRVQQVASLFEAPTHTQWRRLRDSEESRYLGLVLPSILGRLPYQAGQLRVDSFAYHEDLSHTDSDNFLWVNAAYAYAGNLVTAFSKYGWLAAIRGVEGGGLVESLPVFTFRSTQGDLRMHCPVQVAITDRLEKQLSDEGFMALVYCRHSDYAAFFSGQSAQSPGRYHVAQANANARLSAQMPYVFAISRIAHYLKAIVRDKIGSFNSAESVQNFLNQWLSNYVLLDDHASQEAKARFPLREAQVEVIPTPGQPGQFKAAVFLRPHFQLDELTVSLRLVTELPQSIR